MSSRAVLLERDKARVDATGGRVGGAMEMADRRLITRHQIEIANIPEATWQQFESCWRGRRSDVSGRWDDFDPKS